MGNRIEQLQRIGRKALVSAPLLPYALATASLDNGNVVHAEGVDPYPNVPIERFPKDTFAHPMIGGQVPSYGFTPRFPRLELPERTIKGNGQDTNVLMTNGCRTGLDLLTNPQFIGDFLGNDAVRTAQWLRGLQKGDRVTLMDQDNNPVANTFASDDGFAGILTPSDTKPVRYGIRVDRANSAACSEFVETTFGNISAADYQRLLQNPSPAVIDAAKFISSEPAKVNTIDFLPAEQVLRWTDAAGRGFFRPVSLKGEGYTRFAEFSILSSFGFTFRDKGNVGEFFALARGARQVRLDIKTHAPFVNDLRQGQAAPALWLDGMQPGTKLQIHDRGGVVLAEARGDDAGFGGIELPAFDAQFIITLDIPVAESPQDIRIQMGPARPADLAKDSTVKLAGVSSRFLDIVSRLPVPK